MKLKKTKYIGPCDSYEFSSYCKPMLYGNPIMKKYDYSRNGALHLSSQGWFNTNDIISSSDEAYGIKNNEKM